LLIVLKITHTLKLDEVKHGVPQGSILGPLFSLIHINYLPTLSNKHTEILLYADDTSITVNSPSPYNYQNIIKDIFCSINKCFKEIYYH
jgi:hypothetical protein